MTRVEIYFTPNQLHTPYTALEPTTTANLLVRGAFSEGRFFELPPTAEF